MDREKCENALETLKDFLRQTIFIEKEATASKISEAEVILFELIEKHEQLEERYKLLKESYDELLGNAVKLQEGICPLCENYECKNPPLKFEELKDLMVVWDNKQKEYIQCLENHNDQWLFYRFGDETPYIFQFEENRYFMKEVDKYDMDKKSTKEENNRERTRICHTCGGLVIKCLYDDDYSCAECGLKSIWG